MNTCQSVTKEVLSVQWDPVRQRVYASAITLPVAPEGTDELSTNEILEVVEPTDVNQVWVISRLSGSEDVISLRSSSGTFLTAAPSGALSASTPSRGPLESFSPSMSDGSSLHPNFNLKANSAKYLSVDVPEQKPLETTTSNKFELRGDVETLGDMENWKVKCQREFVVKARIEAMGGMKGKKRAADGAGYVDSAGTLDDEKERNRKYQTWGSGLSVVSHDDRHDIKKARKEGRINEAMLDRRAKLKQ
ncbi:hypothetical protein QFC22_003364 [Naganishia vaughanmartiniae]|uniref:Uncharacterized protein n=1 Tax=Naganishia vaughanmartiniae TaxID=1424756 RepID=A0ACC2X8H2_9TREE|nr:hypothetical protein QFC22_003364 [Naganishia vaughanmartiniae]